MGQLPDLAGIGYPIAEVEHDGSCLITKPEGTGGIVSAGTVTEQLLYEIDDPAHYRTPDVDVDFTTLDVVEARTGSGRRSGERPAGRRRIGSSWPWSIETAGQPAACSPSSDAMRKRRPEPPGRVVLERVRRAGFSLADSLVECFGGGDVVPGVVPLGENPWEVILRVTVRDRDRRAVERFCRELAPLVTSGPPGIAGYAAGRPTPRPAFGYWPALIPRSLVEAKFSVRTAAEWSKRESAPQADH